MNSLSTESTVHSGLPQDVADAWATVVLDILEKDESEADKSGNPTKQENAHEQVANS